MKAGRGSWWEEVILWSIIDGIRVSALVQKNVNVIQALPNGTHSSNGKKSHSGSSVKGTSRRTAKHYLNQRLGERGRTKISVRIAINSNTPQSWYFVSSKFNYTLLKIFATLPGGENKTRKQLNWETFLMWKFPHLRYKWLDMYWQIQLGTKQQTVSVVNIFTCVYLPPVCRRSAILLH